MKPPAGSSELLSTDTVKEIKLGAKIAKEKIRERGEKQISTKPLPRADLESAGHNKGGGNIPEAYTAQPY